MGRLPRSRRGCARLGPRAPILLLCFCFINKMLTIVQGTYFVMCLVSMEAPEDYIGPFDVCGYIIGVLLSAFALWAKSDAYRVIGDFAWSMSLLLSFSSRLLTLQTGATSSSS